MNASRIVLVAAMISLFGFGCAPIVAPPASHTPTFGEHVTLQVGESVAYADGLTVKLGEINDSRCPADVQCIWAGELAATFTLSGGKLGSAQELHLGTTTKPNAILSAYRIDLVGITTDSATISIASLAGTEPEPVEPQADSGVHATASIGPTCPVERMPPDPACADKPYQGQFVITSALGGPPISVSSGADGTFSLALDPGNYTIALAGEGAMPSMSPQTFTVVLGSWTNITLSLDSGIR